MTTTEEKPQSALYETIQSQPGEIRAVLEGQRPEINRAVELLAQTERIFLAGTGTSSHAAVVGEHLLRSVGVDARATTNFDFVNYGPHVTAHDAFIEISHRGSKTYGKLALERAREAGATVIGLTGQTSPMSGPEVVIHSAAPEVSSTHTASYTSNLAALAAIAVGLGERTGQNVETLRQAVQNLPAEFEDVLREEGMVVPLARDLATAGRLVLAGAGPNAVTAREGALKVKESSFITAEGFELETILHGGLQAIQRGDVAVVIAAHGPALSRVADLIRALGHIGAHIMVIADRRDVADLPHPGGARFIEYPPVPEALSPILAVIPLQILAAYTAHFRGTNADNFRKEEERYRLAGESYQL
ncbi:MAG: SIS domain-containing protein [Chloroflexota bacterium]|nr:SIS domain-containing protein [Chloroflexota bacterium]